MKFLRLTIATLVIASSLNISAQDDAEFRMEIGAGMGTSFYLGDVNEKFFTNQSFAFEGLWRYMFNPRNSIKLNLAYGGIKGKTDIAQNYFPTDIKSKEVSPTPLEYDFSSSVVDFCCMYELNFWPYGYYQSYKGYKRLTPFLQLGFGFTYGKEKDIFTANIPMGVGIKYKLAKRLNVALDWTIHFSLNDKLDGLDAPLGITTEGIRNNDSYSLTMLTLTYSFAPICPNCNKE